jgi:hypothetical protein
MASTGQHRSEKAGKNSLHEASLRTGCIACGLNSVAAIMPQAVRSGKPHQGRARFAFFR